MKQVFFTLVILAIPVVALSALLYTFGHGLYTVFSDWMERKQLEELRQQTRLRAQQRHLRADTSSNRDAAASPPAQSAADRPSIHDPLPRESSQS
jgi:hypothetical protein